MKKLKIFESKTADVVEGLKQIPEFKEYDDNTIKDMVMVYMMNFGDKNMMMNAFRKFNLTDSRYVTVIREIRTLLDKFTKA